MDEIDGKSPDLVRLLAAEGIAVEDIAGMTRTSVSYVRDVLDLPAEAAGSEGANTTPDKE